MARTFYRSSATLNTFLAVAVFAFLIAGCTPATDDGTGAASASSVPAPSSEEASPVASSSASSAGATASQTAQASQGATATAYADGTYDATGNYVSPAGAESVDVTITLDGDVITDATFHGNATHPTSMRMQGNFAAGFQEQVVGKSIDEVSLGVVNGSSLAPKGFMDALAKIKAEARA